MPLSSRVNGRSASRQVAGATLCFGIALALLPVFASSSVHGQETTIVEVPGDWRSGIGSGTTLYRTRVRIPAAWSERRVDFFLEGADDAREASINGSRIVRLGEFPPDYRSGLGGTGRYELPRDAVRFDDWNEIEIRIHHRGGRGSFNLAAPALFTEFEAIHLAGSWEKRAEGSAPGEADERTGFDRIEPSADVLERLQRLEGDRGAQPPEAALALLTAGEGLTVEGVLTDPIIGQPLSMKWDDRGRLWVAEYLQYPNPAGLRPVSRDTFLRTVYDGVPAAPPHHVRGRDRISIHEDTDEDGKLDRHSVFVDGLNLATSFALGRGGVFVLNPPYLLFYPDADRDDVPDGNPQVLLEGFGIEDSHSIANSLRWGPDGWLYAAQGSTVSGAIVRPGSDAPPVRSVGQLIWRYHPPTARFEIFAEGGGNAFGVEIDSAGRIFSGHNGGDTRGFHYVQGGYLQKGFSKHGELSNPYAFGYFSWMTHHSVPRFTHTFVIEEGGLFPPPFAGRLFGVEPLQGRVVMSDVARDGSTYRTTDVGYALVSNDSWFRPVDIQIGPDGAIYVADFYEQRIDHGSHYQGRVDPGTGRIYRIAPNDRPALAPVRMETADERIAALEHPNRTVRQIALARLFDEPDSVDPQRLRRFVSAEVGARAIDLYWGLEAIGDATRDDRLAALSHSDPIVRTWAVRLAADAPDQVDPVLLAAIVERASIEEEVQVRSQIASSARRLAVPVRLELIDRLVRRDLDADDKHLPLLLWWAIEKSCSEAPREVVELATRSAFAETETARSALLPRIMRRFVTNGRRHDLLVAADLLAGTSDPDIAARLLEGFDAAVAGRPPLALPESLARQLLRFRGDSLELKVLLGDVAAIDEARRIIGDESAESALRLRLIEGLAARRSDDDRPLWLALLGSSESGAIRSAAIGALASLTADEIGPRLIEAWRGLGEDERLIAQTALASRANWAAQLIDAVEQGTIGRDEIVPDTVRRIGYHDDSRFGERLTALWPEVRRPTTMADEAGIARASARILAGNGNPYDGRDLYAAKCGKCHRLFGAGGDLGPELTGFQRTDLERLLANLLTPSLEIREGYETTVIETDDGLILTGFVESQDETQVVIRQADGRAVPIPVEAIVERFVSPDSLMPTGLLDDLDDQQLRDLFAYLRSAQPLP